MNKITKTLTIGTAALFMATVLVAFVPAASAQQNALQVTIQIGDPVGLPGNRLLPETGRASLPISMSVTLPPASGCAAAVQYKLTVTKNPSYAQPIVNPSSFTETYSSSAAGAATTEQVKTKVSLVITTNRNAPAFEDGLYEVRAEASAGAAAGGCTWGPGQNTGQNTVKNDFLALLQVTPTTQLVKSGQNARVEFPIQLINLGNGPTKVSVTPSQENSKNKLESITQPSVFRLQSLSAGPQAIAEGTLVLEAQTPHSNGYINKFYTIDVESVAEFDGQASGDLTTDEQVLTLTVQVQGVYAPGFEPIFLVGAIAVGMLVLRRRTA